MTKTRKMGLLAAAGLGMGLVASTLTLAQDGAPPAGGGGQGGGPGGGRGGDFRARMEEMMKERLSVGEDEWKVIQPRIQKIMMAQMQSRGGMFGGRGRGGPGGPGGGGGGGGQGGPGGDMPQSEVSKAAQDLSTVLESKESKPEDVKAKLTALRQARDKARQEITKAQGELREIVTPRQEAVLVMMNVLD